MATAAEIAYLFGTIMLPQIISTEKVVPEDLVLNNNSMPGILS